MNKTVLDCDLHDYIEIACMHKYVVELTTHDGMVVNGICVDTSINAARQEIVVVNDYSTKRHIELVLTELTTMVAMDSNPHFEYVKFA